MSVRYIDTFFRLTRNVNILNYKSLGISNLTFKNIEVYVHVEYTLSSRLKDS